MSLDVFAETRDDGCFSELSYVSTLCCGIYGEVDEHFDKDLARKLGVTFDRHEIGIDRRWRPTVTKEKSPGSDHQGRSYTFNLRFGCHTLLSHAINK